MFGNLFSFLKGEAKSPRPSEIKPVVVMILDGFGLAPPSEGNAIAKAAKPNIQGFYSAFPHGELIASGESVGLPANEVGNTEVGHLTIGAGRVIDQDLIRINKSIENGVFKDNKAFLKAYDNIKTNKSKLHIMGLVGNGNVHSSLAHFWALLDFCTVNKIQNVYFHLFTDGRDSPPREGITVIDKIESELKARNIGAVASVSGRYYAMDRDGRWDRTQKAYDAISMGRGLVAKTAHDAMKQSYEAGKTDEFVEPTVILNAAGHPMATVDDGDSVIFFNFRIDRPRQLTMAFVLPNFENLKEFEFGRDPEHEGKKSGVVKFVGGTFKRQKVVKNLFFVTMTEYQKNLPVSEIAFPKIVAPNTLGEVISKHNLAQLRMSESEKERFVTYYFNGLFEGKFPGEEVVIVPSPKVATYDLKPEMSAFGLVSEFKRRTNEGRYHFVAMNFANADMVGHTGNLPAAVKAVEYLDRAVGEVVNWTLALGGTVIITADHGNAEELLSYPTTSFFITTEKGRVSTDHTNNPVPVFIISPGLRGNAYTINKGTLADIAPTVLDILKIEKPPEMSGKSLLSGGKSNVK